MISEILAKAGVDVATSCGSSTTRPTTRSCCRRASTTPSRRTAGQRAARAGEEAGKSFKEWYPASFGIKGTFNTILANTTFAKDHPTATADFLRAELHAFDYCGVAAHVAQCVGFEASAAKSGGASFDVTHATAEWKLSVSLMESHTLAGKGIGVETVAEWQPEAKAMATFKTVKTVPPLASAMNTTIASGLYRGTTLIWPAP